MIHDHNPEIPNIVSMFAGMGHDDHHPDDDHRPHRNAHHVPMFAMTGGEYGGGKGWWLIYAPEVKRPIK